MPSDLEQLRSTQLRERIDSERSYHDDYYRALQEPLAIPFDLANSTQRRPHNLTWAFYDAILEHFGRQLNGKRILEIGCGTGSVTLNLSRNGAYVDAFDVSEEAVAICMRRAAYNNEEKAKFLVSAMEDLDQPENYYDAVVGHMVLHHLDISAAMEKVYRYLKPGGLGVFAEWKEYAVVDRVRRTALLQWLFRPGGVTGYATEYERKLSRRDFQVIRRRFPNLTVECRYCLRGKVEYFSPRIAAKLERFDCRLLQLLPCLNPFTDGAVLCVTKE
ncbi:MAG TPA: class I SAM-dependent methyltransferase [Pirellulales bacterium]|nr:class I SAM-dependent methyltransferase [Pirellulales bacterium]